MDSPKAGPQSLREQPGPATGVFLIDPTAEYRQLLTRGLRASPGLSVVGEADAPQEALPLVRRLAPSVVLVSLLSLEAADLESLRQLRRGEASPALITLVPQETEVYVAQSIAVDAAACLLRTTPVEYVISVIYRVLKGERPILYTLLRHADIAAYVLARLPRVPSLPPFSAQDSPLSPRERQVLQTAMTGSSNREIANRLGLREQTVKNQMAAVLRKLHAQSRTHAVVLALRYGWISPEV